MKNYPTFLKIITLVVVNLLVSACQSFASTKSTATQAPSPYALLDASVVNSKTLGRQGQLFAFNDRLIFEGPASKKTLAVGRYTHLDAIEAAAGQWFIAATDSNEQQVIFAHLSAQPEATTSLPARPFSVNATCLVAEKSHAFAFIVSEDGFIEQWLIADQGRLLSAPKLARSLPAPPEAEYCFADNDKQRLFVNEESLGIWAYDTRLEADVQRILVAQVGPQHALKESAKNMLATDGALYVIDSDARELITLTEANNHWQVINRQALTGLDDAEQIQLISNGEGRALVLRDDTRGQWFSAPLQAQPQSKAEPASDLAVVPAWRETTPVSHYGDAADDPAIWVNPLAADKSLILGTNKKAGLEVYDLSGKRLQSLAVGRLNNVDVRNQVTFNRKQLSLAVASNRDSNSLSVFTIDTQTRHVAHAAELPTGLQEIYGLCLYQPTSTHLYAFANDKNGDFIQYQLTMVGEDFNATEVRRFTLDSQPEGCVADDQQHALYVGEEGEGVWLIDAAPEQPAKPVSVIKVGDILQADVEGLALYHDTHDSWLVISSQGNDSYVVVSTQPPFAVRGAFRIGLNSSALIDGASETDGLAVTSANLGGELSKGLLVVQDGHNRLPQEAQNFKLVPWAHLPFVTP